MLMRKAIPPVLVVLSGIAAGAGLPVAPALLPSWLVEDPLPAGFEAVNPTYLTESAEAQRALDRLEDKEDVRWWVRFFAYRAARRPGPALRGFARGRTAHPPLPGPRFESRRFPGPSQIPALAARGSLVEPALSSRWA
jgi:hypothetical protein